MFENSRQTLDARTGRLTNIARLPHSRLVEQRIERLAQHDGCKEGATCILMNRFGRACLMSALFRHFCRMLTSDFADELALHFTAA
jgi:hypothetical protein